MKKKIISAIIITILLIIAVVFVTSFSKKTTSVHKQDFYLVKEKDSKKTYTENTIFTSYEEFSRNFSSSKLEKESFKEYNYLLIPISYDSCSEKNLVPVDYKIIGEKISITIEYEASCGGCAPTKLYYVLKMNKDIKKANIDWNYKAINDPGCDPDIAYKPMIYLYPKERADVTVTLGHSELLTTTYPKYTENWNIIAYPDGTLVDEKGREYYGLYWEGKNHFIKEKEEGFIVKGEETSSFLEEKLKTLGMTDKEANEFIVYWLPKLEQNPYNYIYFETEEEVNLYMPLEITPTPDTVIRILMDYKPLEEKKNVKEQTLITPTRDGFTVVEWGGSLIH